MQAQVYKPVNTGGNHVLVFSSTPKQINYIAIDDTLCYSIHKARIVEFLKTYTATSYPGCKFAYKVLTSTNIPTAPDAQLTLRRIIMETANVITVTVTGELIGRFADQETAIAASPDNAVVISSPEDFEFLTKAQLRACITSPPEGKVGKTELETILFAQYSGTEVSIPEPKKKGRTKKEPTERAPREKSTTSVYAVLRAALLNGEVVSLEDVAATCGKSLATAKTQLGLIRYAKDESKLDITSGHIEGKLVYVLTESAGNFVFDAVVAKAGRTPRDPNAPKGERAPKTSGACYEVHQYLNANPEMNRKDAIAALVAQGINPATASTQYGKWKSTNKTVTDAPEV